MAVRNLASRVPSWLFAALRLQEPALPNQLETDRIVSQLDVFQGGHGLAEWKSKVGNIPANSALTTIRIIQNDADTQALVAALSIHQNAGLGAKDLFLRMVDDILLDETYVAFKSLTVAGPSNIAWTKDLLTNTPFFVPPGHSLIFRLATGAGGIDLDELCLRDLSTRVQSLT